ncbi:MAG: glucokinase [Polyangiales bacterium]
MQLLAGDIGGTKTLLALYRRTPDGQVVEVRRARFVSRDFHGLAQVVRLFLAEDGAQVQAAAFGVAGPVHEGQCTATNLPWRLDSAGLARELGIPALQLLNDFHAVGLAIPVLGREDLCVLQDRPRAQTGPLAILGAGTGLGQALLLPSGQGALRALPSEGGHTDFAPRNDTEITLLRFLLRRHHRVSYERVVSGPGIVTLYEFVTEQGLAPRSPSLAARFHEQDPAAVISQAALQGEDVAAEKAIDLFISLYGAEAGNLALKVLPTGGLFIAGGIAPRLLPKMQAPAFLQAFTDKGRMSPLLEAMYVAVIQNTDVGLLGAREAALRAHA